jgi:hypothetical protein
VLRTGFSHKKTRPLKGRVFNSRGTTLLFRVYIPALMAFFDSKQLDDL